MCQLIQIVTTASDESELERIAHQLLQQRLAACCQIDGPIRSFYRWQGNLETAVEYRLSIKTTQQQYAVVEQAILQLHTYDQPQVFAIPIVHAASGYEDWVRQSVSSSDP